MPNNIDGNMSFDYGRVSADYAAFRPSLPDEYFDSLRTVGVGIFEQSILDLGTGTGVVAIELAKRGCRVCAVDVSKGQIDQAKQLAAKFNLNIDFRTAPAEDVPFYSQNFDAVVANQSFLYFDKHRVLKELRRVMKDGGKLILSQFRRSPEEDMIASATDALIMKYNPTWGRNDIGGGDVPFRQWLPEGDPDDFVEVKFMRMDFDISYSRESWLGRIRATRAVGASLDPEQISLFNSEHEALLNEIAPPHFSVKHRMEVKVLEYRG